MNFVKKWPKNDNFKTIGKKFYHPKNRHFLTKILKAFSFEKSRSNTPTALSESVVKKGVFTSKFSYICPKSCLGQKWSFFWTKMPITP
jgi:hypothetical protein